MDCSFWDSIVSLILGLSEFWFLSTWTANCPLPTTLLFTWSEKALTGAKNYWPTMRWKVHEKYTIWNRGLKPWLQLNLQIRKRLSPFLWTFNWPYCKKCNKINFQIKLHFRSRIRLLTQKFQEKLLYAVPISLVNLSGNLSADIAYIFYSVWTYWKIVWQIKSNEF